MTEAGPTHPPSAPRDDPRDDHRDDHRDDTGDDPGENRWRYGLYAVLGGTVLIALIAVVAILRYPVAADAATATAPFVAAIGAITGAYFGIQAGSANQARTHDAFVDASHRAERWAALADPSMAAQMIGVPDPAPTSPVNADGRK
ncbi:hypothetical protein PHK61_13765 [Actinomycetospora lutea]|uniref:hypothetical protein n=1 Tax=Actinomycetospora lutea TaxID=663604 RepID=UPI00236596BC|nr:hypothetical protein [Actinomycetospora lutea]MDD7939487.1 hypothetical protein [Actinomycetospora lutea]